MEIFPINYKSLLKYEEGWCKKMRFFNPYVDPFNYFLSDEIPYFDGPAYNKYPQHNWVYDKLLIAQSQNIKCGILNKIQCEDQVTFPIFIKPRWGHKSASSKNCFKIMNQDELNKYVNFKHMMWSEFIDDTEGMTDFILLNGQIKHQITYNYSEKQNGFSDEWKYISPKNKPPINILQWVENNMRNYTGIVNVQYRGDTIIEVGLRFARGGAYILITQNKYLIQNINNVVDKKYWDHSIENEMIFEPYYSFKCFVTAPIIYIYPQYMLDFMMSAFGSKPFYEYYFEPVGTDGIVVLQFMHDDFDKGMKLKKLFELLFSVIQYLFFAMFIIVIIMLFKNLKLGLGLLIFLILLLLTRYLNPINVNYGLFKAKQQVWFPTNPVGP